MSDRLVTLGTGPAEVVGAILAPEARVASPVAMVAVVGAVPTSATLPFAMALIGALGRRGVRTAALQARWQPGGGGARHASPADPLVEAGADPVLHVRVDPGEGGGAVETALEALPSNRTVVALGAPVPAIVRPRLMVIMSGGLPRAAWSEAARRLADRADVELCDLRPGFVEALATRW